MPDSRDAGPEKILKHKKIGAESSDPNRRSQPRLPGSVVGDASMRRTGWFDKITKVNARKLPKGGCRLLAPV
jgi:hypothetical protein